MKFSLMQLTQQGSSEGLCVIAVMAASALAVAYSIP
jgi:hypothetical protein